METRDNMIELEEKMTALATGLPLGSKAFPRQVPDLELRNRFGDQTQLLYAFAARALARLSSVTRILAAHAPRQTPPRSCA
jgi:hypothetical protein